MKKLISRIITLALTAALLLTSAVITSPVQAKTAWTNTFKYPKMKRSASYPIKLNIGGVSFQQTGTLKNASGATDEEISEIINECLEKHGITAEQLIKLEFIVRKALKAEEPSEKDMELVKEDFLSALSILSIGGKILDFIEKIDQLVAAEAVSEAILDGLKAYVESGDIDSYYEAANKWLKDEVKNKAIEALIEEGGKFAGEFGDVLKNNAGNIVTVLNMLEHLADRYMKDQNKKDLRKDAYTAAEILKAFYEEVNQRIRELESSRDRAKGWEISLQGASALKNVPFQFVEDNYLIKQTWTVNLMLLKDGEPGGAETTMDGTYSGVLQIQISNDMTEFDNGMKTIFGGEWGHQGSTSTVTQEIYFQKEASQLTLSGTEQLKAGKAMSVNFDSKYPPEVTYYAAIDHKLIDPYDGSVGDHFWCGPVEFVEGEEIPPIMFEHLPDKPDHPYHNIGPIGDVYHLFTWYDSYTPQFIEITPPGGDSKQTDKQQKSDTKEKENTTMTVPIETAQPCEVVFNGVEVTIADRMPEDAHMRMSDDPSGLADKERPGILVKLDKDQLSQVVRENLHSAVVILSKQPIITAEQITDAVKNNAPDHTGPLGDVYTERIESAEKNNTHDHAESPGYISPEVLDNFTYEGGKWFVPVYTADGTAVLKDEAIDGPLHVYVAFYDSSSRLIGYYSYPETVTIP